MKKEVLEEVFIQPIQELIELFSPFIEMTEKIIDQKALLLSPPEFMINPSYDPTLHEIAERRNEAYNEIARLYEIVNNDDDSFIISIKSDIQRLI